ncbi:hypothetical protein LCG56_28590 (plasmid) [Pseudomonas cannabina pv. alisalensis]|uniref:Uncharacterized protein n=1 Tax=Pseudomonas syringae pv. maculicola str. ES4326 TaxID=629265 RepID=A0A8T8CC50_PSEYM|nr:MULTISPECIES: hypothetical protein [Pseudomonas syringae group]QHF00718.1 hypothetical protein PMA4326_029960 [Pseudomonas syringae pv. maculicola str. ES4326]UBZ00328.1 hypothetical protein LCG56_28590 [Pseudomonas cannabina pv. alisalensis]
MSPTSLQQIAPASGTHVLFFADVHDLSNISDGLIGPEFHPSAHAALLRFVEYALPHISADHSLLDSCATRLAAKGHGDFLELGSLPLEKVQSLSTETLEELANTYASARQWDSYQCFFKVARVPA